MDRAWIEALIDEGLSLEQIGELVGRDPSTIGYWCKKHGLTPNGRAKHAARGGRRSQRPHGPVLAQDSCARVAASVSSKALVDERGGRCALCGYDRSLAALHFHHLDPASNCHAEVEAGIASLPS
jgi:hypothetical protein